MPKKNLIVYYPLAGIHQKSHSAANIPAETITKAKKNASEKLTNAKLDYAIDRYLLAAATCGASLTI